MNRSKRLSVLKADDMIDLLKRVPKVFTENELFEEGVELIGSIFWQFFISVALCCTSCFTCFAYADMGKRVVIGVLENSDNLSPEYERNARPEDERLHIFQVRVVFENINSSWKPFRHGVANTSDVRNSTKYYPAKMNWYVVFNGKTVGQLSSTLPRQIPYYSSIGLHVIHPNSKPHAMGDPTLEFAGWTGEKRYRPLVLVSRNNSADPQDWKPSSSTAAIARICLNAFRNEVAAFNVYDEGSRQMVSKSYENDMAHIIKTYKSNVDEYLVAIQLDQTLNTNDGPTDVAFYNHWFHVDHKGATRHLGKGMSLIDAGDYDSDGISEVLFWYSGYNEDGYILFYDQFSEAVDFMWHYH